MNKNLKKIYRSNSILIFNSPHVITDNNFYIDVFRIPEVLNRLRQYRELLNSNDMNIPVWVYCLTQDIKSLTGSPQPLILNFLISLGLFDRWLASKGWPHYVIGSDFLFSVINGNISFEEQALLLSNGYGQENSRVFIYQTRSYYNHQSRSFCLTGLDREQNCPSLNTALSYLKDKLKGDRKDWYFHFLSPHSEELMEYLKSLDISPRDFLEGDADLKWLWPLWKKTQMEFLRKEPVQMI